jgi:hypothetical protein
VVVPPRFLADEEVEEGKEEWEEEEDTAAGWGKYIEGDEEEEG